jgi:hypothetical protein
MRGESNGAKQASIEIIMSHNMVSGTEQLQDGHCRAETRREGKAVLAVLQRREGSLETVARRVAAS